MADTEKPVLPPLYPTKTRLKLAKDISVPGGRIRHWHWLRPETRNRFTDSVVTARVAEFVAAGLADLGEPNEYDQSTVSLTPAGEEWLNTHGASE